MCSTRTGDFAKRCNMAMVELEPVPEEDDLMEKLHHHGGDLEHKGRVDVSGDMTSHDEERLYQLISNHLHYTGSARGQGDPRQLGGLPAEIPQGHAGRVPPRAARDGTHAHGRGGGVNSRRRRASLSRGMDNRSLVAGPAPANMGKGSRRPVKWP